MWFGVEDTWITAYTMWCMPIYSIVHLVTELNFDMT